VLIETIQQTPVHPESEAFPGLPLDLVDVWTEVGARSPR